MAAARVFNMGFTFDEVINADDTVIENHHENHSVKLLVDPMSFQYLAGAEIDYEEKTRWGAIYYPKSECKNDLRLRFIFLGLSA